MKAEAALNGTATAQIKAMTAAENEHYAALEAMLTAEEKAAIVKQMRIAAIQSLLTAQQQEYLSNIGLTASSNGYEAAALSVMTVEQRLALSKVDLTTKSAAYRAAIAQETAAKQAGQLASLEAMRTSVKEAAVAVESAKSKAIAATQAVEAARYEVYWAQQSGNATAIAAAQNEWRRPLTHNYWHEKQHWPHPLTFTPRKEIGSHGHGSGPHRIYCRHWSKDCTNSSHQHSFSSHGQVIHNVQSVVGYLTR